MSIIYQYLFYINNFFFLTNVIKFQIIILHYIFPTPEVDLGKFDDVKNDTVVALKGGCFEFISVSYCTDTYGVFCRHCLSLIVMERKRYFFRSPSCEGLRHHIYNITEVQLFYPTTSELLFTITHPQRELVFEEIKKQIYNIVCAK